MISNIRAGNPHARAPQPRVQAWLGGAADGPHFGRFLAIGDPPFCAHSCFGHLIAGERIRHRRRRRREKMGWRLKIHHYCVLSARIAASPRQGRRKILQHREQRYVPATNSRGWRALRELSRGHGHDGHAQIPADKPAVAAENPTVPADEPVRSSGVATFRVQRFVGVYRLGSDRFCVAVLMSERVLSLPFQFSTLYNEGWNAFQAHIALSNSALYPPIAPFTVNNYRRYRSISWVWLGNLLATTLSPAALSRYSAFSSSRPILR